MGPGSRSPQLRKGARLAGMTISERRQGCVNPAGASPGTTALARLHRRHMPGEGRVLHQLAAALEAGERVGPEIVRSEEHTSELQSLMRSSYAVFCLKKKKMTQQTIKQTHLND